jgi:hypothetical protein
MRELEKMPLKEDDFIDKCLGKYRNVKGFEPFSYGLLNALTTDSGLSQDPSLKDPQGKANEKWRCCEFNG